MYASRFVVWAACGVRLQWYVFFGGEFCVICVSTILPPSFLFACDIRLSLLSHANFVKWSDNYALILYIYLVLLLLCNINMLVIRMFCELSIVTTAPDMF